MNPRLFFALCSGGGHHHHWDPAKTGKCTICGKQHQHQGKDWIGAGWEPQGFCDVCGYVCPHDGGFEPGNPDWYTHTCSVCGFGVPHVAASKFATRDKCCHCSVCDIDVNKHRFNAAGLCETCNWQCPHESFQSDGDAHHSCTFCAMSELHTFEKPKTALVCRHCEKCGLFLNHFIPDGLTTCTECGYECTHDQPLAHGLCPVCGAVRCTHETLDTSEYSGEVHCQNSACGATLKRPNDAFFVRNGPYMGAYSSYRRAPIPGTNQFQDGKDVITGVRAYTCYLETRPIKDGVLLAKTWAEQSQQVLFALNVTEPTSFGGTYKYTVQGLVFADGTNIPVNPDLLEGNGKNITSFKQFNQDNTPHTQAEGKYTSPDFPPILGMSVEDLIASARST